MANYVTLTDTNFKNEVLDSSEPVLVDFTASWCGPCRMIAPYIEQLADDFQGRAKIGKLDVDSNPMTARAYNVMSIPNLLFFKDGKVVDQLVGAAPKGTMAAKLEALVEE